MLLNDVPTFLESIHTDVILVLVQDERMLKDTRIAMRQLILWMLDFMM
jgi:hypothetical protein